MFPRLLLAVKDLVNDALSDLGLLSDYSEGSDRRRRLNAGLGMNSFAPFSIGCRDTCLLCFHVYAVSELQEAMDGLAGTDGPSTRMAVLLCRSVGRQHGDSADRYYADPSTVKALVVAAHLSINEISTVEDWLSDDVVDVGDKIRVFVGKAVKKHERREAGKPCCAWQ